MTSIWQVPCHVTCLHGLYSHYRFWNKHICTLVIHEILLTAHAPFHKGVINSHKFEFVDRSSAYFYTAQVLCSSNDIDGLLLAVLTVKRLWVVNSAARLCKGPNFSLWPYYGSTPDVKWPASVGFFVGVFWYEYNYVKLVAARVAVSVRSMLHEACCPTLRHYYFTFFLSS